MAFSVDFVTACRLLRSALVRLPAALRHRCFSLREVRLLLHRQVRRCLHDEIACLPSVAADVALMQWTRASRHTRPIQLLLQLLLMHSVFVFFVEGAVPSHPPLTTVHF